MATYAKAKLSGSTDGKSIVVSATSASGTTIHTALTGTTNFDEVWLWACNIHTADIVLTMEYGGSVVANNIVVTIPFNSGLVPILPGLILNNGEVIKAFAGTTNVINLFGFVNVITA